MDRLKREANPPVGQLASPVPQAWDPNLGDFREITGQNLGGGRFGTDGVQWGKTASGLFVPIKVTNDGAQEVQLSGTIVEETIVPEQTITASKTFLLSQPAGIDSVMITAHIKSLTGTFEASEGVGLIYRAGVKSVPASDVNFKYIFQISTNRISTPRTGMLYISPGATEFSGTNLVTTNRMLGFSNFSLSPSTQSEFGVHLSGTNPQAVVECTAYWFKK